MEKKHFRRLRRENSLVGSDWRADEGIENDRRRAAFLANTGTPCSCFMCGNLRKLEGLSLQEKKANINTREYEKGNHDE